MPVLLCPTNPDAFWFLVEFPDDPDDLDTCWIWCGNIDKKGYGNYTERINGDYYVGRAHRLVLALQEMPPPASDHVHHRCRRKCCIRPSHLQVMTASDHSKFHNPVKPRPPKQLRGDPPHGTVARYQSTRFKCRCTPCRQAMSDYRYEREHSIWGSIAKVTPQRARTLAERQRS